MTSARQQVCGVANGDLKAANEERDEGKRRGRQRARARRAKASMANALTCRAGRGGSGGVLSHESFGLDSAEVNTKTNFTTSAESVETCPIIQHHIGTHAGGDDWKYCSPAKYRMPDPFLL